MRADLRNFANQEIVAAGVGLGELDHSSSALWKVIEGRPSRRHCRTTSLCFVEKPARPSPGSRSTLVASGGLIVDQRLSRSEQVEVIRSLVEQLPRWASFSFVCNPGLSYADLVRSAFEQAGFHHAPQMTYLRLPSEGDVLNTRKSKHKGHIKRAAKELDCVDVSAKEFVHFFEANLKARRKRSYSPLDTMTFLIEEAVSRGQARAIAARPHSRSESVDHGRSSPYDAAIVYVWDKDRCYYWLSTYRIASADNSNAKPHPDATKLLAVRAMEHAQAMNLIFDADGVATPGAANLYRNMFGLSDELCRDVFHRETVFERLYQRYRQQFKAVTANVGMLRARVGQSAVTVARG